MKQHIQMNLVILSTILLSINCNRLKTLLRIRHKHQTRTVKQDYVRLVKPKVTELLTPKAEQLNDHFGYDPKNSIYNPSKIQETKYTVSADNQVKAITYQLHQKPKFSSECSQTYPDVYRRCELVTNCEQCLQTVNCEWCKLGDRCQPLKVEASNCRFLCYGGGEDLAIEYDPKYDLIDQKESMEKYRKYVVDEASKCQMPIITSKMPKFSKEASKLVNAQIVGATRLEIFNDREGYVKNSTGITTKEQKAAVQIVRHYSNNTDYRQYNARFDFNLTSHDYQYKDAIRNNTMVFDQPLSDNIVHKFYSSQEDGLQAEGVLQMKEMQLQENKKYHDQVEDLKKDEQEMNQEKQQLEQDTSQSKDNQKQEDQKQDEQKQLEKQYESN